MARKDRPFQLSVAENSMNDEGFQGAVRHAGANRGNAQVLLMDSIWVST
jgi:hypothetical protein